ncbi:MAG: TVP38/TMEM64 family protein [Candidatus Omnitrophica bacterium]|nr:TVP38/TMEM64 family protein [Candidatus Omnitrophota bacterium]
MTNRKFIVFLIVLAVWIALGIFFRVDLSGFKQYLDSLPLWASGVIFIVSYVTLTFIVLIGPKDVFKIIAALIYGAYISTAFVYAAEMVNLIVLFTFSRRLGRDYIALRLKGKMQKIDDYLSQSGFWSIFFLRLFPIVPFRFLDLGMGLTKIGLGKYFLISAVASLPRIFFIQFFLTLGLDVVLNPVKLNEYLTRNPQVMYLSFAYCLLAFIFLLFWRKRKA